MNPEVTQLLQALEALAEEDMTKNEVVLFKTELMKGLRLRGWSKADAEELAREFPVKFGTAVGPEFINQAADHIATLYESIRDAFLQAGWNDPVKAAIAHAKQSQ